MSVSHPLLKKLKGHIYDLRKDGETEIRDHHAAMLHLCHTLEEIFQTGLKTKLNTPFGLMKKDYWFWIQFLYEQREKYRLPFALVDAIESVQNSKKVFTNLGRSRLFIRTALSKKVLQTIVKLLLIDELFLFSAYDPKSSILGDDIMCEIFLSLLHELNKVDFKLELKVRLYIRGRIVVVKVDEGSVAAEENQIEPGDVLDELYGKSLYRCSRGLISALANKYRGLPIYLSVVKGFYAGSIYSPLKPIFEKLHIRKNTVGKNVKKESDFIQEFSPDSGSGSLKFNLVLLGRFQVHSDEKAECIDKAISKALDLNMELKEVTMYVTEREIKIFNEEESEVLVHKHFSEISACGRKKIQILTCTIAEEFQCLVLRAKSPSAIATILELIAHGFVKTHWEV
ncbi:RUN domain-containing protein [Trichonephila inaurata madagascariensis]|uniref:RUN domain-containing protein n=1 Tax=Trichonephila inaurata madagascariensis TaxID=2747483 RepID=A0A8X6JT90_9ARAC|nr:RUN domain-containing protein [Trichonephila inaurata madagascariensis]